MYHIVCVNLQSEFSKYNGSFTIGVETTAVVNMLSEEDSHAVLSDLLEFGRALFGKWEDTTQRNLENDSVLLWERAKGLDPFLKGPHSTNFKDYSEMISLVVDHQIISDIKRELLALSRSCCQLIHKYKSWNIEKDYK